MKYHISIKGQQFEIAVGDVGQGVAKVTVNGVDYDVQIHEEQDAADARPMLPAVSVPAAPAPAPQKATLAPQPAPEAVSGGNVVKAPMPGLILDVQVRAGDAVKAGQTVIIMEAMKMENSITVKIDGTVKEIHVQKGAQVMTGHPLLVVE